MKITYEVRNASVGFFTYETDTPIEQRFAGVNA